MLAVAFVGVVAVMVLVALLSDTGDDDAEAAPPGVDDSVFMPAFASLAVGAWTELRPGVRAGTCHAPLPRSTGQRPAALPVHTFV